MRAAAYNVVPFLLVRQFLLFPSAATEATHSDDPTERKHSPAERKGVSRNERLLCVGSEKSRSTGWISVSVVLTGRRYTRVRRELTISGSLFEGLVDFTRSAACSCAMSVEPAGKECWRQEHGWERRYRHCGYYRRLKTSRTVQLTVGRMAIVNRPARRASDGVGVDVVARESSRIKSDWSEK